MSSKRLKYTFLTAVLLAVVLVVSAVPIATAKSNARNNVEPVDGVAIEELIEKLEPFVTRCDDGTFRLDIPADAKIDTTSKEFKAISAGMRSVNKLIQEGTLLSTSNLAVYSAKDGQFALQDGNRSQFKWRWYGFEVWMDHNTCETLQSCGNIAAIIAAMCAVIPSIPTVAAAAIAAYLGIGAEILGILDNGCGVHLKFAGVSPPVCFYARGQSCG
jgi:hypothetical protein